jgi:hypothetical protein
MPSPLTLVDAFLSFDDRSVIEHIPTDSCGRKQIGDNVGDAAKIKSRNQRA